MPIIMNGTAMTAVKYNGTQIRKVVFNGTTVFNATPSALIPTMTSTDTPEETGNVTCSSEGSSLYQSYFAFDNNDNTWWISGSTDAGQYIGYNFKVKKVVTKFILEILDGRPGVTEEITLALQASNNGSGWVTLKTFGSKDGTASEFKNNIDDSTDTLYKHTYSLNNTTAYKYYRLYSSGKFGQGNIGHWGVRQLQLYGYEL